jgi:hypothetical protein
MRRTRGTVAGRVGQRDAVAILVAAMLMAAGRCAAQQPSMPAPPAAQQSPAPVTPPSPAPAAPASAPSEPQPPAATTPQPAAPAAESSEISPPSAEGTEPLPSDFIELKSADHIRYESERRIVRASGNVRFAYQEVEVSSDDLVADLELDRAVLSGNVILRTKGQEFRGETLLVHLDTRQWEFTRARAAISPQYFERGVLAPLYLGAGEVLGLPDHLRVLGASFTTCDLPQPHYEVTARRLRIWPGRKLIADHATVWILGRRIFTLPWFVIPLRQPQRQPIVPVVGQDEFQGAYLKTLINYVLNDSSYGSGHLDFMSRRGIGTGIEHAQIYPHGRTDLYLYQVHNTTTGANELTARASEQQDFGGGLSLRASADLRNDNYYYTAGSRVTNTQVALTSQRQGGSSSLGYDYSSTGGAFDFTRWSVSLRDDERGPRYGLSLDSRYDSQSTAPGEANDLEWNNRVELTDHERSMDARLVVSKRFDPDGNAYTGDNFYQVVDHLPELMLETDSYRMKAALAGLPAHLTLSFGNFAEQPTGLEAYRVYFGYQSIAHTIRLTKTTRVNLQPRFEQFLYGDRDHTAQYDYGGNVRLQQDLGGYWQAQLGYALLQPEGYTPFRFDYVGAYRTAAFDLNYSRGQRYRAQIRTAYDARFDRWQDVVARLDLPLHRNLQFGVSSAYDPNHGMPRDLLTRFRFGDYRTALEVSADYQPQQGRLSRVTGYLDWVANSKWRMQLLSSYDGVQRQFVWGEVLVTRQLHCWEATAYYSLQRNMFELDFRIKAFEWGKPDFGVGRSGQYLDTSLGEWY